MNKLKLKIYSIALSGLMLASSSMAQKSSQKKDYVIDDYKVIATHELQIDDVKEKSISVFGFAKADTPVIDVHGNIIDRLNKYDKIELLPELYGDFQHIKTSNGICGYIETVFLEVLPSDYVEVDISDQKLYLHKQNEVVLNADVITGKPETPTNLGYSEIYYKNYKTNLMESNYVDNYMCFNTDGEGFHDADGWRSDDDYNNKELYLSNGSHGCVNMKQEDVSALDNNVEVGEKVFIHK